MAGVTGSEETSLAEPSSLHRSLESVQASTAIMPDYALPAAEETASSGETEGASSIVNPETSLAGVLGSVIIAALVFAAGYLFGRNRTATAPADPPCPCSRTPRGNSARWTGFPAETPDSTVWTPVLK